MEIAAVSFVLVLTVLFSMLNTHMLNLVDKYVCRLSPNVRVAECLGIGILNGWLVLPKILNFLLDAGGVKQ